MFRQQTKLEAFDHGVLFYQNPAHKHQVLFNCLEEGWNQGKGAFYVAGDELPHSQQKAYGKSINVTE